MVFTIEPGLYVKPGDLAVPAELRGIGVRIEDDVLVTADGAENLSAALPREPDAVVQWMARLRGYSTGLFRKSDVGRKVSDMSTITMRTLSRETARVLDELPGEVSGVVVTRDGVPVARLTPISVVERDLYSRLAAHGVDIDNPPPIDPNWHPAPAVAPGEKSASDYLMEDRNSYYDEP